MKNNALDRLLFAMLGLFAVSVVFSVTVVETTLFAILLIIVLKSWQNNSIEVARLSTTKHQLFIPWMIYLGICLLTALTAYYPLKGLGQVLSDIIKYLCLATLLLAVQRDHLPKLSIAYIASAATAALIGLAEITKLLPPTNHDITRADAFMNAVRYGEVMGIAALFALSQMFMPAKETTRRLQVFYSISAAIIFMGLLASKTRGAYLGTLVGITTMIFIAQVTWKRIAAIISLLVLVTTVATHMVPHFYGRLIVMEETVKEILSPVPSKNVRPMLWQVGIKMFADNRIFGVGPDNVKPVFKSYCPELILNRPWGSLHNLYVHQAAERGLLGIGALILVFGAMLKFAFNNYRKVKNAYTLWALCVLPAFYVMNITEISFQHVHTSFAIFLALAFSSAAQQTPD